VRRCSLCRPLLFCVDGCRAYIDAIRRVFREPIPGQTGRPCLRAWDGIAIAQVVKQYAHRQAVGVTRRIVQGAEAQIKTLLRMTQGGGMINTAYIERLNATFRSRIATLVRRGRALARQIPTLQDGMHLVGTVYNFCTYHRSLRGSALLAQSSASVAAQDTHHCSWADRPQVVRQRAAIVLRACAALAAAEAAREAIKGYASTHRSVVYLTTVKCGATSPFISSQIQ
jgi:hypothetical protein